MRKEIFIMKTQSNENTSIFKETMGEEWIEKQDSFFDFDFLHKDEDTVSTCNKDFNMLSFVTEALFNFF